MQSLQWDYETSYKEGQVSKRPMWKLPVILKIRSEAVIASLPLCTVGKNSHKATQIEKEGKQNLPLDEKDTQESVVLFNPPFHTQTEYTTEMNLAKNQNCEYVQLHDLYRSLEVFYLWSNCSFVSVNKCSPAEQVLSRADYHWVKEQKSKRSLQISPYENLMYRTGISLVPWPLFLL